MVISSFFDIWSCIQKKNRPTHEEIDKHCSQWMINNLLSSEMVFAPLAAELCKMTISNQEYFELLYHAIPKNNKFIKYNSKRSKTDKEVKYIMDYYGCSLQTAKEYSKLISAEEIKTIIDLNESRGKA